MSRPETAVIILNWNGSALLRRFLPSVVENTPTALADVIVADNGSEDDSLQLLAERFPGVGVVRLERNYGFAEGYNRAIAQTRYRYTVLLNSDVECPEGWLEPLVEYMHAHPQCGACQPKLLSVDEPTSFEYAGACGGYLDRHGFPYCRGRIFGDVERDSGQYDTAVDDLHWATGAALMVDTALYEALGGLEPAFFAHMEEIDLCWRMRLAGRTIAVVPQARVYHLGGGSLAADNPRKTYLNFRNNLLMMHRNLPAGDRRRALFVRRLLDTAAFARFLLGGKVQHARAVLRAHRDYSRMRRQMALSDAATNMLRGAPDILVQYYLRGRKYFSQLAQ